MTKFQPRWFLLLAMSAGSVGCSSLETLNSSRPPRPYEGTRKSAYDLETACIWTVFAPVLAPITLPGPMIDLAGSAVVDTLILPITWHSLVYGANSEAGDRKWRQQEEARLGKRHEQEDAKFQKWLEQINAADREDTAGVGESGVR